MAPAAMITGAAAAPAIFEVSRATADVPAIAQLRTIKEQCGLTAGAVVSAFSRLAFGPGKIAFADFTKLRLFDTAFIDSDPRAFVGQRLNRDLCVDINFRHDWLGLMANKVAAARYLSAYGLPTIPIKAIYAPQMRGGDANILRDADELRAFLLQPDIYPLFGKPIESYQSLGALGLTRVDRARGELIGFDGTPITLSRIVSDIQAHYAGGYLFQPMLPPHPVIDAICGRRLATVRIITIATADGPRVFRACWKIPAAGNIADNYWRRSNLLAQIDPVSGEILRVTSGLGLTMVEHTVHPDSRTPLIGVRHPEWAAMLDVALDGARLMRHVPLIGWDMACTTGGVVIVEMNEAPDFFLAQFADRRGVLDDQFAAFRAFQKMRSADHQRATRALLAKL